MSGVRETLSACSSSTRGVFLGGYQNHNTIEYITIASAGDVTDFGDLTQVANYTSGASSNKIRGVVALGAGAGFPGAPPNINTIEYITIASTGNSTDFGDRTVSGGFAGACSNGNGGLSE